MSRERRFLQEALTAGSKVARRLKQSRAALLPDMPIQAEHIEPLVDDTTTVIDAMIKRVESLQDLLERRVFRSVLLCEGEPLEGFSARDAANRLEKLGAIPSADAWGELSRLRNRLAHEYPLHPEKQAARINDAFAAIEPLIGVLDTLQSYAETKGLVGTGTATGKG